MSALDWTRYAIDLADPPTVHVLAINPPTAPGPFVLTHRLCHPGQVHVIASMLAPHANEVEVLDGMESEHACDACRAAWLHLRPTQTPQKKGRHAA